MKVRGRFIFFILVLGGFFFCLESEVLVWNFNNLDSKGISFWAELGNGRVIVGVGKGRGSFGREGRVFLYK